MTALLRILSLCQTIRFQGSHETQLQDALDELLRSAFSEAEREVQLTGEDRVDFMVGTIAIEVKIDGSTMEVMRQLQRYAKVERVERIVLVTTRSKHLRVPMALAGKPVFVVLLSPF